MSTSENLCNATVTIYANMKVGTMKTMLVYHDDIPALRKRYKYMTEAPDFAMIRVENWHHPYRCSNQIKSLDDFITATLVPDPDAIDALITGFVTHQPQHICFVLPMGELHSDSLAWAGALLRFALEQCQGLWNCSVTVKIFEGLEHDLAYARYRDTVPEIVKLRAEHPLPERLALYLLQESYLTWRMSTVLSQRLGCQVGMDRAQFVELQTAAVASGFREPVPELVAQVDYASPWVSPPLFTPLRSMLAKHLEFPIQKKLDTYQELAMILTSYHTDTQSQCLHEFRDPELDPYRIWWQAVCQYQSSASLKLRMLTALDFIGNPYRASRVLGTTNRAWFREQGFRGNRDNSKPCVEARLDRAISDLYDLGCDRLIPFLKMLQERQLACIAGPLKACVHRVTVPVPKNGRGLVLQIPGIQNQDLIGSWLGLQTCIGVIAEPNVIRGIKPVLRGLISDHSGSPAFACANLFPEIHLRAMSRLLDKGYLINATAPYLTEFGAAMLVITERIYGEFFASTVFDRIQTQANPDAVNQAFRDFKSRCDTELPDCELRTLDILTAQHDIDGVNAVWNLRISTRSRAKRIYWKSGKLKRGVDLTISLDRQITGMHSELTVSLQYGYETQDSLGETRYINCECGGIVGYREFDDSGISFLICPGCGKKHPFFLIPKTISED